MVRSINNEIVCYETDASRLVGKVKKVVFPESVEEVKNAVKCASSEVDIVPRGGGSNIVGGCIPQKTGSIILDTRKMNKVLNFDTKSRTVYAEVGVTIKELNEKLKSVGFEFPVLCNDISTIGGMIARNEISDFGRYGSIKNWVEEIEFVNGRGELIKLGKADLSEVCGMEGITGIILKAKLKIIPLIYKSASIFQSDNLHETLLIAKRLKLEEDVIMLRICDPFVSKLIGFPEKYNLIIFFNSDKGRIKSEDFDNFFEKIRKINYLIYSEGFCDSLDAKFFIDKIDSFILFLEEIDIPYFGDLINGIIFSFFSEKEDEEKVMKIIEKMNGKPVKYGFGLKRKGLIDSLQKKIIHRVKLRHDPFYKFNKRKVFDVNKKIEEIDVVVNERSSDKSIKPVKEDPIEKNGFLFETPEEKMNRIIKEAEGEETVQEVLEVKDKLLDYEQTFKSELSDERVKNVEDFAKDVSREIVKKEDSRVGRVIRDLDEFDSEVGKVSIEDNLDKPNIELRGKVSDSDKSLIDNIMTNKFGFSNNEKKEGGREDDEKKEERKENENK